MVSARAAAGVSAALSGERAVPPQPQPLLVRRRQRRPGRRPGTGARRGEHHMGRLVGFRPDAAPLSLASGPPLAVREKSMNQGANPPLPLGDLSVRALIAAISSERPSPGAGAAGAIVLALAAACAGKAATIALKHRPEDAELQRAVESFAQIALRALLAGDADAAAFERFLHDK